MKQRNVTQPSSKPDQPMLNGLRGVMDDLVALEFPVQGGAWTNTLAECTATSLEERDFQVDGRNGPATPGSGSSPTSDAIHEPNFDKRFGAR